MMRVSDRTGEPPTSRTWMEDGIVPVKIKKLK